jgi:hypothetical protein
MGAALVGIKAIRDLQRRWKTARHGVDDSWLGFALAGASTLISMLLFVLEETARAAATKHAERAAVARRAEQPSSESTS